MKSLWPARSVPTAISLACAVALLLAQPLAAPSALAHAAAPQGRPVAFSMEGNYLAARFAGQQSDFGASADYFAEALLSDPEDPFLLERTLSFYLAAGQMDEVRDYALRLNDADKGNALAALVLGIDDLRRGRWSHSIDQLGNAASGPLLKLVSEVLSAWDEVGAGQADRALERLGRLQGDNFLDFFRKYHSGLIESVVGDDAAAVRWFDQALQLDDASVLVIDAAARAKARAGDRAGAVKLVDSALAKAPGHALLQSLATTLADPRQPLSHVRTVRQGAAEILSGLGSALVREDAGDMGLVLLQLSLSLNPSADLARVTLADSFEKAKRFEDAIAVLRQVPTRSPIRRNAEVMIAFDYNALDRLDQARTMLDEVVRRNPGDRDALLALGDIMRVHKRFPEAASYYDKVVAMIDGKATGGDWQIYYYRGIAEERSERWPEAEADFRKALALKPDQPLVLNYLGYSLIDRGLNLEEALTMIEKAVELDPTDGFIVDSLGWAYYKLDDYGRAVDELEKAIELQPGDATINDHLGDAYWRVGRHIEARFQWNHAKTGKPEAEELAKIEEKLANGLIDPPPKTAADATTP